MGEEGSRLHDVIGQQQLEEILRDLVPPPVVDAVLARAKRENTTLTAIVKDALYDVSAKAIIDLARVEGRLPNDPLGGRVPDLVQHIRVCIAAGCKHPFVYPGNQDFALGYCKLCREMEASDRGGTL